MRLVVSGVRIMVTGRVRVRFRIKVRWIRDRVPVRVRVNDFELRIRDEHGKHPRCPFPKRKQPYP